MRYSEYLRSDWWLFVSTARKRIDGYKCAVCGSREKLNVHHRHYNSLRQENVKRDLVTLCHRCHACLHRIQKCAEREAEAYQQSKIKLSARQKLRDKITELLIVEIWIRDKGNGGDVSIWEPGKIDQLCGVVKWLYPGVSPARKEIKKQLYVMWVGMVCATYNRNHSQPRTAKVMCVDSVDEVLAERGFGKVR